MECIEMKYCFNDNGEVKEVKLSNKSEDGVSCTEICDMFVDFMESAGYSLENVEEYFTGK